MYCMPYSKCPVIPTRVESLVWTKPERNWLDKMWLDSGVGELDSGVGEFILAHILGNEIIVKAMFLHFCLNLKLALLSLQECRMA